MLYAATTLALWPAGRLYYFGWHVVVQGCLVGARRACPDVAVTDALTAVLGGLWLLQLYWWTVLLRIGGSMLTGASAAGSAARHYEKRSE
jgi:hypothetical protein